MYLRPASLVASMTSSVINVWRMLAVFINIGMLTLVTMIPLLLPSYAILGLEGCRSAIWLRRPRQKLHRHRCFWSVRRRFAALYRFLNLRKWPQFEAANQRVYPRYRRIILSDVRIRCGLNRSLCPRIHPRSDYGLPEGILNFRKRCQSNLPH